MEKQFEIIYNVKNFTVLYSGDFNLFLNLYGIELYLLLLDYIVFYSHFKSIFLRLI